MSDLNYIVFILGYDLLQDKLKGLQSNECDVVFDICNSIASLFVQSEEYKNTNHSMYEMLCLWIANNEMIINQIIKKY